MRTSRTAIAALVLAAVVSGCLSIDRFPTGPAGPGPANQTVLTYEHALAGNSHGCVLVNGGRALCWGSPGDLGNGTNQSSDTPVRVEGPQTFAMLDLSSYSCGVTTNGEAWCWGSNEAGRLGDGTTDFRTFPTAVATGLSFRTITTGAIHTCALTPADTLHCWGSNQFDQLGGHPGPNSTVPVPVGEALHFRDVDAGGLDSCGIAADGETYCWGNRFGPEPVALEGDIAFDVVSVGGTHVCGLTSSGAAWCFGENSEGQLGDESFVSTPAAGPPVPVSTTRRFRAISAGEFHTCAIDDAGEAWCWGRDNSGQLGDSDPAGGSDVPKKAAPTRVVIRGSVPVRFVTISAGRLSSCAVSDEGRGYCWGFSTGSASQSFSTQAVRIGS